MLLVAGKLLIGQRSLLANDRCAGGDGKAPYSSARAQHWSIRDLLLVSGDVLQRLHVLKAIIPNAGCLHN